MKIKNIIEILNVGNFVSFKKKEDSNFEKLAFIFGLNTYGKTTLCDIFQSLSENDSSVILARRSIPNNNQSQSIKIRVDGNDSKEKTFCFENNSWSDSLSNLDVFGSEFIHKNLFTGLTIDHENKKNFTRFILGDEGSILAKDLEKNKKKKSEQTKNLPNLLPQYIRGKSESEIKLFLNRDISNKDLKTLKEILNTKNQILQKDRNLLKQQTIILNKKEVDNFSVYEFSSHKDIENIQSILSKTHENIQSNSKELFLAHINKHFKHEHKAQSESWIQSGLKYIQNLDSGQCLFCGQDIVNAKSLIEVYNSYFNEEYKKFVSSITSGLDSDLNKLKQTSFKCSDDATKKATILKEYSELFVEQDKNKLSELEKIISTLKDQETNLLKTLEEIINKLQSLIDLKKKEPSKEVTDSYDYSSFKVLLQEYFEKQKDFKEYINWFQERVVELKKPYKENTKQVEIEKLEEEIRELEIDVNRLEQNDQCIKYLNSEKEIKALSKRIKELSDKIEQQQSQFLTDYFKKINELFKQFGSKDFELVKEGGNRGHSKVYSLVVKYKGEPILNDNLSKVFSESDKRALALSVFLSKIFLKDANDKKSTIVVLDDPITSFDDSRIRNANEIMDKLSKEVSQIIILTHYEHYIKRCYDSKFNGSLHKINKDSKTSYLESCDKDDFCLDDMSKNFYSISRFINRENNDLHAQSLRVYLENYLKFRFIKQIDKTQVQEDSFKLGAFIQSLKDKNIITEKEFDKLFYTKNCLNPDHHLYVKTNVEDIRSFASEMIDFLHDKLGVNPIKEEALTF